MPQAHDRSAARAEIPDPCAFFRLNPQQWEGNSADPANFGNGATRSGGIVPHRT
jgi:hypothetical protein